MLMYVLTRKFENNEVPAVFMGIHDGKARFGFPMPIDNECTCALLVPEAEKENVLSRVQNTNFETNYNVILTPSSSSFIDKFIPLEQWMEVVKKYGKFHH